MNSQTKQIIKASLITPWVVVPVTVLNSLWYLLSWLGKPLPDPSVSLMWPHPFRHWETVFLYSLYGVPTAYILLLIVGLPCYFIAQKLDKFGYLFAIFAASLACFIVAGFYVGFYSFLAIYPFLLLFGIPLAITFVWILKSTADSSIDRKL